VDAAMNLGVELGLKAGTIKSWMNTWSKENGSGPVKVSHRKASDFSPKRIRVWEIGHPRERQGTIMEVGPVVSAVQWDERVQNKDIGYVTNKYLVKLNSDGTDNEDELTDWQRETLERLAKKKK